jgi:acyl carrier protein
METAGIKEKIIQCFTDIGIFVDKSENFLLTDYVEDSVAYMTFLVGLEQTFGIEIPDEYLGSLIGGTQTFEDLYNMIESLLKVKT